MELEAGLGHSSKIDADYNDLYLLVSKKLSPEFSSICFGDTKVISLELPIGKDGFDFCQHVTEDKGQFCKISPVDRRGENEKKNKYMCKF